MRIYFAAAAAILLATSLTGCAQKHATLDDCFEYTVSVLESLGHDPMGAPEIVVKMCADDMAKLSESEFDDKYLPN